MAQIILTPPSLRDGAPKHADTETPLDSLPPVLSLFKRVSEGYRDTSRVFQYPSHVRCEGSRGEHR